MALVLSIILLIRGELDIEKQIVNAFLRTDVFQRQIQLKVHFVKHVKMDTISLIQVVL